eukprot:7611542-Alexandrium_andersonii.AAC.1
MSASLVGSEMCIRDRHRRERRERVAARVLLRVDSARRCLAAHHSAMNLGDCLLYTSDAADDM